MTNSVTVRPLTAIEEYATAVRLQRQIWGWDDLDLLPVRFFVVASSIGGQVLGAFDQKVPAQMCGFLLAIPSVKPSGKVYLHSHMLGVLPEFRDSGAGLALKLAQKQDALARGIALVEWSFDPLQLKNAYFNLEKLGAVVRQFKPNLYGHTTSTLQAGLPTDRLIAEWDLPLDRVRIQTEERVSIPSDIDRIKRTDPELAREIQSTVAAKIERYLAAGLTITGFERSAEAGVYLFSRLAS